MKANQVFQLALCFFLIQDVHSKARKRATSCTIPEDVRGSWQKEFTGHKKKIRLNVDINEASAKLHMIVGDSPPNADDEEPSSGGSKEEPSSSGSMNTPQVTFDCVSQSDDGYFLTENKVSDETQKWSDIRDFYALKKFSCFKFKKEGVSLQTGIYSFQKKPAKIEAKEVCSGMEDKKSFNTFHFIRADKPKSSD
ncbi:uncharacterized protein [Montipora foliosa]|uniref:uncharacterized protein n=1 Tax=Montipora foliosa TaxID=591990 RepID=UPI0035F1280B